MAYLVVNNGEIQYLQAIIDNLLDGAVLSLYQNDHTPTELDAVTAYQEATFSGYVNVALNNWGAIFTDPADGAAKSLHDEVTFTHNGGPVPNVIFGYFVHKPAAGLLFAEKFGTAISMSNLADEIALTLSACLLDRYTAPAA